MTELLLLFVVALLVLGPDKLPAFARRSGSFIRRLRQQAEAARRMVEDELALGEHSEAFNELRRLRGEVAQLRAAISTQAQQEQWWLPNEPQSNPPEPNASQQKDHQPGQGVELGKDSRPAPISSGPDASQQAGSRDAESGDAQSCPPEPIAVQLGKTTQDHGQDCAVLHATSPQTGHEEAPSPQHS